MTRYRIGATRHGECVAVKVWVSGPSSLVLGIELTASCVVPFYAGSPRKKVIWGTFFNYSFAPTAADKRPSEVVNAQQDKHDAFQGTSCRHVLWTVCLCFFSTMSA